MRYAIYEGPQCISDHEISYYATNETTSLSSIPESFVSKFLNYMKNHPSRMFIPGCCAQIVFDYDTAKIIRFTAWISHEKEYKINDFSHIIEALARTVSHEMQLNDDFEFICCDRHVENYKIRDLSLYIAKDIILQGYADRCKVAVSYIDANHTPLVSINCFGTEYMDMKLIYEYVDKNISTFIATSF